MKCCLCGDEIEVEANGWDGGNNPAPLMEDTDKNPNRCCNYCNSTKVIPERIKRLKND